ncbi:MAG: hypothetical protein AAGG44_06160, partial [Planctomycetota bacterium]
MRWVDVCYATRARLEGVETVIGLKVTGVLRPLASFERNGKMLPFPTWDRSGQHHAKENKTKIFQ